MNRNRKIEIFSAGCSVCDEAVQLVKNIACPSCDIEILDMKNPTIANKAKKLGIHKVPSVVVDGKIAECCAVGALNQTSLKWAGIGQPL